VAVRNRLNCKENAGGVTALTIQSVFATTAHLSNNICLNDRRIDMSEIVKPGKQVPRKGVVAGLAARRAKHLAQRRATHVASKSESKLFRAWSNHDQALKLFRASVVDRVNIVKDGVPALYVNVLTARMGMPKDKFYRTMGLMRPTVDRKMRASKLLNQDESERVMGIARIVGQAQSLVQESGGSEEFDAARWIAAWLDRPLPALSGRRPGEFMDTGEGRTLVADLLAQQQSGAYA
jgi:putative toxin-antitoxin system antitoxin component (TIGR02293 family)